MRNPNRGNPLNISIENTNFFFFLIKREERKFNVKFNVHQLKSAKRECIYRHTLTKVEK